MLFLIISVYTCVCVSIFAYLLIFYQVSAFGSDPPCVDSGNLAKYLNKPEVRKALHIPSYVQDWDICRLDYYLYPIANNMLLFTWWDGKIKCTILSFILLTKYEIIEVELLKEEKD